MRIAPELPPLRPFQARALEILGSRPRIHLICVAGTGAGKSRIFEEAARIPSESGVGPSTLVVAPLQALVRQHAARLGRLGVRIVDDFDSRRHGPQAFVTTPERLARKLERGMRIPPDCLLVVDECHCIQEWGESFRPMFRILPDLPNRLGIRRSMWLSATLSHEARSALSHALPGPIENLGEFSMNPLLHSTRIRIAWPERPAFLRRWLEREPSPGILFCSTRGQCLGVSRLLQSWSSDPRTVAHYHAGMTVEERLAVERGVHGGRIRWISATSAFGMGMDFAALRWVILWQVPFSVLDLAQMLGRAGRVQGQSARAFLLWDDADFLWLRQIVKKPALESLEKIYRSGTPVESSLQEFFAAAHLGQPRSRAAPQN
jgi:ATP-dependent DNA helicase RecQ